MFGKIIKLLFVVIVIGLIIAWSYYDSNNPMLYETSIATDKYLGVGNKFTILQISDFHNAQYTQNYQDFISKLIGKNIDVVILTGDMLEKQKPEYTNSISLVKDLVKVSKFVFYVSGSQDWDNPSKWNFEKELTKEGVTILNNSNRIYSRGSLIVNICGVDDFDTKHYNMERAFSGINPNYYTILLSHSPKIAMNSQKISADLVFSGKTLGGQVILPLLGGVFTPNGEIFPKYNKGFYTLENGTNMHIDSGLGTGKNVFRLNNRVGVSLIDINEASGQ